MDVYAVLRYWHDTGQIVAVFDSMDAARAFIETREDAEPRDFDIEEHEINAVPAPAE